MWMWKYKVNGYDEAFGGYTDEGVVCGNELVDAVSNLSNYYGDSFYDLYIEPAGECEDVYIINTTLAKKPQNECVDSQ